MEGQDGRAIFRFMDVVSRNIHPVSILIQPTMFIYDSNLDLESDYRLALLIAKTSRAICMRLWAIGPFWILPRLPGQRTRL